MSVNLQTLKRLTLQDISKAMCRWCAVKIGRGELRPENPRSIELAVA